MSPPRGGRRGRGSVRARGNGHGRESGPTNGNVGGRDTANRGAKNLNGQGSKRWRKSDNSSGGEDATPQPVLQDSQETPEVLYQKLKTRRVAERREAISQGLMDDPDVRRKLKDAITFRGTCLGMCPEFEKVERVVQRAVDICERVKGLRNVPPDTSGKPAPERMVKEYRRSAAGNDAPLPSDVRPPLALQKTLNYLIDDILGGPLPLTKTNKFLWTRTRSIRQDFTFQNVGKTKNIHIAVDCFERICRLHILSLHQLSHPDINSGDFSHQQEQEQFFKTLTSIMHFYEDCKFQGVRCKNEAEFCAIYIIAYVQIPDIEKEAQEWPPEIFNHPRVQTALEIHAAWQNIHDARGPLDKVSPDIVQNSFGRFWSLIQSSKVSYIMACVAEIHFNRVRRMALSAIVTSSKVRNVVDDWILSDLMEFLGFDDEDQVQSFCENFGMQIREREDGDAFLSLDSTPEDPSPWPTQIFSESLVEFKRHNRTYPAIVHGYTVRQAREMGLIKRPALNPTAPEFTLTPSQGNSLFFSDGEEDGFVGGSKSPSSIVASHTLPASSADNSNSPFSEPSSMTEPSTFSSHNNPFNTSTFGQVPFTPTNTSPFGKPSGMPNGNTVSSIFGASSGASGSGGFGKPSVLFSGVSGNNLITPTNTTSPFSKPSVASDGNTAPSIFETSSGTSGSGGFGKPSLLFSGVSGNSLTTPTNTASPFGRPSGVSNGDTAPSISGASSSIPGSGSFGQPSVFSSGSNFTALTKPSGVTPGKPMNPFQISPQPTQPFPSSILKFGDSAPSVPIPTKRVINAPWESSPMPPSPLSSSSIAHTPSNPFSMEPDSSDIQSTRLSKAEPSSEGLPPKNLNSTQQLSPSVSSSQIGFGTPAVQTTSVSFPVSIVPEQSILSPSQGHASPSPQPALARPESNLATPQQKSLPPFSFTPTQSIFIQPQSGTSSQQNPLPIANILPPASTNTPSPLPSKGPRMSPAAPTSKPKSILKHTSIDASVNALGHAVPKATTPQAHFHPGLTSQSQLGKAQVTREISDELSDWFLWGKDGLYDQLFEHIFPSIAVSARRQVEEEASRREADEFRRRRLMQRYFYRWKDLAYRNSVRRRGRERRARGRAANNPQGLMWTPVQYRPSADMTAEEALAQALRAKKLIYKPVPLVSIFKGPVEQALLESKVAQSRWALFAVNSDVRSDYWWQNKFGLYNGRDTDTGLVLSTTSNGLTFAAFPRATRPDLFLDIGCVVYGCSVDFSLSNTERFEKDRENLHKTMQYICSVSKYPNIALLVICYRSPLDATDLDFNDVDMERCAKKGRLDRVLASRKALDFKSLPPSVIGRNLVIVDSNNDLDFTSHIAPLAELVLPTVSPNLAKLRASGALQLHRLGKRRSHHGTDELSTANDIAPELIRSEAGEGSTSSGNSLIIDKRPTKRKADESADTDPPSTKSRRKVGQPLTSPSSKRYSLPDDFQRGGIFDGDLLAKWKRLRQELETPDSRSAKAAVGQQQTSPISTSSRGSSLQSGSWSQLHRGSRDKTNTDYFRLKARGIEKLPDGSVAPAALKALPKKRPYAAVRGDTDSLPRPAQKKVQVKGDATQDTSATVNSAARSSDAEDEELFAEARKIMGTIAEGIEFYREETKRALSRSASGEGL
ncbi:hypothetical protein FGG08_005160 [Glutinoglossum americanum]|uniref:SAC3/GANP/THP3 conserved domain-containing protein n=1 Tax=Glutinoglossum americanum TaxID=1670608 RepID=A0A9P8HZ04_9PEZI|nr:hypothetical protein FGG08_005160 [Glutinoglossum americanum]